FGRHLGGDVGIGAEPVDDLAEFVANRQGTGEEPAVLAVLAAQGEGFLPDRTDRHGALHRGAHPDVMVGMMHRTPAQGAHGFQRGAGVVVPALVVPVDAARGVGHPGELAHVVGQGAELLLAGAQGPFRAHALIGGPGPVGHFADEGNVVLEPGARLILQQHQRRAEPALFLQRDAHQALDAPGAQARGLGGGAHVVQHVVDHHQLVVLQVVEEIAVIGEAHALLIDVERALLQYRSMVAYWPPGSMLAKAARLTFSVVPRARTAALAMVRLSGCSRNRSLSPISAAWRCSARCRSSICSSSSALMRNSFCAALRSAVMSRAVPSRRMLPRASTRRRPRLANQRNWLVRLS